jgi:hypothetical protein
MSFTSQNLLDMAEALATGVDLVSTIDYVLPSPIRYGSKAAFWAEQNDDQDNKTDIETTLIRAAQIRYLTFEYVTGDQDEDAVRQVEDPVIALNWECTVFHESKPERLDEAAPLDDFEKKVRKSNQEHITALWGIVGEFQGVSNLVALSSFPDAFTVTPVQIDNTELDTECEFITGCFGDQSKLQLQIRVQLPC